LKDFTTANGLPNDRVFAILVDGDRIWAGTDNGLALDENHAWKVYATADGLAHQAVLSLALDKRIGDIWAGTMGGLSRISGGRIDSFTQLNSGLSDDVVYGISIEGESVWIATAAGACRLDPHTSLWSLHYERNAPTLEIWSSSGSATPAKVDYGTWGSGVLEYDQKTGKWDKYGDPGGENEMVLFKDRGLIHEIVASVSYVDSVLWAATHLGDSRCGGRYRPNFLLRGSGLPLELHESGQASGRQSRRGLDRQGAGVLRQRELGRQSPVAQGWETGDDGARRRRQGDIDCGKHRAGAQLHPRHRLSRRRYMGCNRQGVEPRNTTRRKRPLGDSQL
jgi:hypothetical protein